MFLHSDTLEVSERFFFCFFPPVNPSLGPAAFKSMHELLQCKDLQFQKHMFPCTPHKHLWCRNLQCAGPGNGRPLTATLLMTVAIRSERVRRCLWQRSARCCGVPWRTEWSPWWSCGPAESGRARAAAAAVPPLCVCGRVYVGTCASCWSLTPRPPPSADSEVGTAASGSSAESRREMEDNVNCLLFLVADSAALRWAGSWVRQGRKLNILETACSFCDRCSISCSHFMYISKNVWRETECHSPPLPPLFPLEIQQLQVALETESRDWMPERLAIQLRTLAICCELCLK